MARTLEKTRRRGRPVTRTLVVTNDFPTRRGGIETFVLSLCQQLPADEVVVYTASMPGGPSYDATLAFPVHRDPTSMLLPTPRVGARVERVLRETGCDRVLFGASAPLGLLAGRLRAAGARAGRRADPRPRGVVGPHARGPAGAAPDRRRLRRADLRQRVVPRPDRAGPVAGGRGRACGGSRPASTRSASTPAAGETRCALAGGSRRTRRSWCAPARMVRRKGQDVLLEAWPAVLAGCRERAAAPGRRRPAPRSTRAAR